MDDHLPMIKQPLTAISLASISLAVLAARDEFCLYSVHQGGDTINAPLCSNDIDPLRLSDNHDVRAAMSILGIDKNEISFKGCEHLSFKVKSLEDGKNTKFEIYYDTTAAKNIIAPILHEISHINQIKAEGSYQNLTKSYSSERIELGADYTAGYIFRKLPEKHELNEFEQNINLAGLYIKSEDTHGNPSRRDQAFRLGVFDTEAPSDARKINLYFQREIYGKIN